MAECKDCKQLKAEINLLNRLLEHALNEFRNIKDKSQNARDTAHSANVSIWNEQQSIKNKSVYERDKP